MLSSLSPGFTLLMVIFCLAMTFGILMVSIRGILSKHQVMNRRLAGLPGKPLEIKRKSRKNLIALFGQHLSLPDAKEITRMRFVLSQAGFYTAQSVPIFYAVRVLSLILPQFILIATWWFYAKRLEPQNIVLIGSVLILAGMFGPSLFVQSRVKKRRQNAREGFPDMVDLLVSCVEAGLGLDAALMNVSKEIGDRYPVLKVNLDLLNLELMAGRSRHEALKNFADRLGLEETKALAVMLKQAEEMGSPIGKALRIFSDEMRTKRMLLAEERALALSAKLTVPLVVFIFPTIMGMLMLPAAVKLGEAFV
ncbi:MAG: type II secretion system F family protein [Acidimicrobiales bacterium]|nr:MAG: type II secretion system F family protein [Acidimicrobiales bacterium]